jgi:hypothetical protein
MKYTYKENNNDIVETIDTHITCINFMKIVNKNKDNSKKIKDEKNLIMILSKIYNQIQKKTPIIFDNKSVNDKIKCISSNDLINTQLPIAENNNNNNGHNILFYKKFPFLFHKYLLQLSNPLSNIIYTINNNNVAIIQESKNTQVVLHIHCFNIDHFQMMYGPYIAQIKKYFSIIIVTYTYGKLNSSYN